MGKKIKYISVVVIIFLLGVGAFMLVPTLMEFSTIELFRKKDNVTGPIGEQSVFEENINKEAKEIDTPNSLSFKNSMRSAMEFISYNRSTDPSERPVLGRNQILIGVSGEKNGKKYILLASTDSEFKATVGDEISFEPIVSPEDLVVQNKDGTDALYYSYELKNYRIPESLSVGDKVVFKCKIPGCFNNELLWAFVFSEY
ncbi:MAG: hypothetical protein KatS3mg101_0510 [Patescibacteria group bacterium]|nr:MAG: hypothetical protein KatS3mg101_0510 [Patescibacteria group bacterium]